MIFQVCALGYAIISLALLLLVQSRNVYPDLLLARLLFSLGGSATATMVTAILPSMITPHSDSDSLSRESAPFNNNTIWPSVSSGSILDQQRSHQQSLQLPCVLKYSSSESSPARLAGLVGLFTGLGALLALCVFLPLPALFQKYGFQPGKAVITSFYIVGAISMVISILCLLGLQNLRDEDTKRCCKFKPLKTTNLSGLSMLFDQTLSSLTQLFEAFRLGFKEPELGLSYIGGFVARASSVGISLFFPLFVNAYFVDSGLCEQSTNNPQSMKETCREGYILAAKLTGVSELVALLCAPIFGFLADNYRHFNAPLLLAAFMGVLGYVAMIFLKSPETGGKNGNRWIFVIVAMIGANQIGAIVCSLSLLGCCVLKFQAITIAESSNLSVHEENDVNFNSLQNSPVENQRQLLLGRDSDGISCDNSEYQCLLQTDRTLPSPYKYQKGSIAGVYSLWGASGILLLTKLGGVIFDDLSPVAPFYLLAIFNILLLMCGIVCGLLSFRKECILNKTRG